MEPGGPESSAGDQRYRGAKGWTPLSLEKAVQGDPLAHPSAGPALWLLWFLTLAASKRRALETKVSYKNAPFGGPPDLETAGEPA